MATRRWWSWPGSPSDRTLDGMAIAYPYGTAHAVVMVGAFGQELVPRRIGPAHATIGRRNGRSPKALCGAYVVVDDQVPWPPADEHQLCPDCTALAAL